MATVYCRLPRVGEFFAEYPSNSCGRRWADVMVTEGNIEVFLADARVVLSQDPKGFPWWAMLAALSVPSIFGLEWSPRV